MEGRLIMRLLRVISDSTGATKYYLNGRRCTRDRYLDELASTIRAGTYNSSFTLRGRGAAYHYCHG